MNTKYIYTFGTIMTVVVALLLAGFRTITKEQAAINEDIFNKRQILTTIADPLEEAGTPLASVGDEDVLRIFDEQVEQLVVNSAGQVVTDRDITTIDLAAEKKKPEDQRLYPLYVFNLDGNRYYVFSVRGNGLWDAIWGNIALESDLNTIAGASFDHAGETPGLGAEIKDNAGWKSQFEGKQIFADGEFVSILVRKGGAIDPYHEVDGLSGATVTADGVTKMLWEGLGAYLPYIEQQRTEAGATSMNLQ